MSAKLLRVDPGNIMRFCWAAFDTADSRAADGRELDGRELDGGALDGGALGGRALGGRAGMEIHPQAGGQRADSELPEATGDSFEQQLKAAQREVAEMRARAELEVRAAFERGVEEGRRLANDAARMELDAVQGRMAQSLSELARVRQEVLAQTDMDLVRLSVAIAEKVLNRQLQMDADALRGIARAALERIAGRPVHAVRTHPEDLEALRQEFSGMEMKGLRLVADASLGRGSLLFETEHGTLDCSIATQLEEIERGLVDRLQRSPR